MDKRYQSIKTVHIVGGESPAGSLRVGLGRQHKVIGFPDFFAVGPLWKLDENIGRRRRYEWLKSHLNMYFEEVYEQKFSKALEEIDTIPNHIPIVIWTAENANEQTGMRYIMNLLKEKNDIFLINTTIGYQELFNTSEVQYLYVHTGEVVSEELNLIYQKKLTSPLSIKAIKQFQCEWRTLSETTEVLRIWKNNEIQAVHEDYFDQLIITSAQKLHAEQKEKDFVKSMRLIGDVLVNHQENGFDDTFLEYRLRHLIDSGVFEIKGSPTDVQHYSVKLGK